MSIFHPNHLFSFFLVINAHFSYKISLLSSSNCQILTPYTHTHTQTLTFNLCVCVFFFNKINEVNARGEFGIKDVYFIPN